MLDEREGPVAEEERTRAFNTQTVWKRIAIVLAGPAANLGLAVLLYWGLFMHGVPGLRPVLGAPPAASAAAQAGVAAGDVIRVVGDVPVNTWQDARWELLKQAVRRGENTAVAVQVADAHDANRTRLIDMSRLTKEDLDGDFLRVLGLTRQRLVAPPEIGRLVAGAAAERAGLRASDEIVSVNNVAADSVDKAIQTIRANAGRPLVLEIRRADGVSLHVQVTPDSHTEKDGAVVGRIGAELRPVARALEKYRTQVRHGPLDSLVHAVAKTWDLSLFTLRMLGKMIVGDVSLKNLSGPITIADYAGQSAQLGWVSFLVFLALVSISLGVLNLLPIPLLDGGHLLYYIVEIFKGSPVTERAMEIGQRVGIAVLLVMMVFALFNDINRLISG
jgi:regulator of sigma E protease